MKRILALFLLAALARISAHAQVATPTYQYVATPPSGACTAAPGVIQVAASDNSFHGCKSGTWTLLGGSSSGITSITSPSGTLTPGGSPSGSTLDLNLAIANIWTAGITAPSFIANASPGTVALNNTGSGVVTLTPGTGSAAATVTIPDVTGTISVLGGTVTVAYSATPTFDTTKSGLVVTLTGNMAPTIPAGVDGQDFGMDFEASGTCATTACVITWPANWVGTYQPGTVLHNYVEGKYFAIDSTWRQKSNGVMTAAASSIVTQAFLTGAGAYTYDSGFTGMAFEKGSLGSTTSTYLNSAGQTLFDLLAPSGHGWLRVGGNSASQQSYISGQAQGSEYLLGNAGIAAFANAIEPTGWNVIWTINTSLACSNTNVSTQCLNGTLGTPTISTVAADISAYTTQIATPVAEMLKFTQDWIAAGGTQGQLYFEAGNEPGAWVNNQIRWQPAEAKNTGCGITLLLGVTSGALNGVYNYNNQSTGNGTCGTGTQSLTFSSAAGGSFGTASGTCSLTSGFATSCTITPGTSSGLPELWNYDIYAQEFAILKSQAHTAFNGAALSDPQWAGPADQNLAFILTPSYTSVDGGYTAPSTTALLATGHYYNGSNGGGTDTAGCNTLLGANFYSFGFNNVWPIWRNNAATFTTPAPYRGAETNLTSPNSNNAVKEQCGALSSIIFTGQMAQRGAQGLNWSDDVSSPVSLNNPNTGVPAAINGSMYSGLLMQPAFTGTTLMSSTVANIGPAPFNLYVFSSEKGTAPNYTFYTTLVNGDQINSRTVTLNYPTPVSTSCTTLPLIGSSPTASGTGITLGGATVPTSGSWSYTYASCSIASNTVTLTVAPYSAVLVTVVE